MPLTDLKASKLALSQISSLSSIHRRLLREPSSFAFATSSKCLKSLTFAHNFSLRGMLSLFLRNTPIIFLHNVTGFMVGAKAEHAGIIKAGAQLVSAVSCSSVPHISIILGASYGAGNYAMCGRAYKPRFLFTWPTGRCSVMGPDQLAGVMEQIQSAKAKADNLSPEKVKERTLNFKQCVSKDAECYSTSGMLIDDGIIDPRDTRDVLGMCLEVVGAARKDANTAFGLLARI